MFKAKRILTTGFIPDMPTDRLSRVMAVDQYPSQDFNKNDCGWISNDLSQLARAQSQAEVELILKRLTEIRSQKSNLPANLKDAYDMIRPRYCQTENEFVDFAAAIGMKEQASLDEAYAAIRAKQIVSTPAPAPDPQRTPEPASAPAE